MMSIGGLEALFYTLSFIIPGFIVRTVRERLAPSKRPEAKHSRLLQLLLYGCVNSIALLAVFGVGAFEPGSVGDFLSHGRNLAFWAMIVLLLPVVLGLLLAGLREWEFVYNFLQKLGFNVLRLEPSAWDYAFFRKCDTECFVLVTFKNGNEIAGKFGRESSATASKNGNDLYLEEKFDFDEGEGQWTPVINNGVWINGGEVRHIQFFPILEKDNIHE